MSDDRHPHRWGFSDTRLEIDRARSVRMTGTRYPLSGVSMPHLIPFVEATLGVPFDPSTRRVESTPVVPPPVLDAGFMAALEPLLPADRRTTDPDARLAHSHGQLAVGEIDRLLYGGRFARVVDVVVEPVGEEEVRAIVSAAAAHDVCLVPFGGGTNVSGALLCPEGETRTIVSIDMRRMCRVLSIDRENRCALVEAGITGTELERVLGEAGYACGHTPDSMEFSTLGGWIATNASGMKKNRYGNIEDIVIEATMVTPAGVIETRRPAARTSTGIQPLALLFGSEGNLGVITRALIAVHPKPDEERYGSLVFRTFADGVAFLKAVRAEGLLPASIRLVNNREFRLGQALRPAAHGPGAWKSALQKRWLFDVLGFDPESMAACTIVMEGRRDEVARQERALRRLAGRFRAVWGGSENGRRGYSLTFAIAYLRDFFSDYNIAAESFETSVPWSRIDEVCQAVERTIVAACAASGVAGRPYLSYRVTQTYHAGVCLYFTMAFDCRGLDDPGTVFHDIEQALRQVVLDHGGSLSHHHGVGKIRQRFLPQVHSGAALETLQAAKRGIDPHNIFGIGNGAFGR
ncbi:MAG: FAD-binding oxidoreductase [Acidobacteriota bacterium]|nr:FAD-binding oxidoreductase [Acidobacteriota bacterium]